MTILTKEIRQTYVPGSPGSPGFPGTPYAPAYTAYVTINICRWMEL